MGYKKQLLTYRERHSMTSSILLMVVSACMLSNKGICSKEVMDTVIFVEAAETAARTIQRKSTTMFGGGDTAAAFVPTPQPRRRATLYSTTTARRKRMMLATCIRSSSHSARIIASPTAMSAAIGGEASSSMSTMSSNSNTATTPVEIHGLKYHHLDSIQRIYCISDLHTDHKDNLLYLETIVSELTPRDLLIVAGDISHEIETFRATIQILQRSGCTIFFVHGNHEAWVDSKNATITNSLEKLQQLTDVCRTMGVYVDPIYVGPKSNANSSDITSPVWILPFESWYDGTLSFNEELCRGFEYWPWVDFKRCVWPAFPPSNATAATTSINYGKIPIGLTEFFLQRNQDTVLNPFLQLLRSAATSSEQQVPELLPATDAGIIRVSHFLPNQQCLPDWKDLSQSSNFDAEQWLDHGAGDMSAKFAKVAGSSLLGDQLCTFMSSMTNTTTAQHRLLHVFGHSHRPKDFTVQHCDDVTIRYVHNPLGKPRERQMYMVSPNVTFQLLWETAAPNDGGGDRRSDTSSSDGGEVFGPQILRYWEEHGGGLAMLRQRMTQLRPRSRYTRAQKKAKQ